MKIISRSMLREHWERPDRADSEQPLRAWLKEAESAEWKTPQDVKDKFKSELRLLSLSARIKNMMQLTRKKYEHSSN